jgi:hypothetical protein
MQKDGNFWLKQIVLKEALNKLIPFMVRQAHHERNQLIQNFLKFSK